MPMPRPRYAAKKKEPTSWGVHIATTLIGGAISLALIWGGFQLVTHLLHNFSLNTSMGTTKSMIKLNTASWTLKSSTEHKAGFTCDDKENPCPSLLNEYTTDKPVTVKQLEALVPGTNEVIGDCQTANESKVVCETKSELGGFEYHSYVLAANETGMYTVVISVHPPKL